MIFLSSWGFNHCVLYLQTHSMSTISLWFCKPVRLTMSSSLVTQRFCFKFFIRFFHVPQTPVTEWQASLSPSPVVRSFFSYSLSWGGCPWKVTCPFWLPSSPPGSWPCVHNKPCPQVPGRTATQGFPLQQLICLFPFSQVPPHFCLLGSPFFLVISFMHLKGLF